MILACGEVGVSDMKKAAIVATVATLAFHSFGSQRAVAMGDFGGIVHSFWSDVIASYWWPSLKDYNSIYHFEQTESLLPGEEEPVGLVTVPGGFTPPESLDVTCADFRVVVLSDDSRRLPFRVHQPKSAIFLTLGGWLSGFGSPSRAEFWIAAMLPEDSVPLFSTGGVGLNPDVMRRPLISEIGWSDGLAAMPATSMILQSVTECDGFSIYNVIFEK